MGTLTINFVNLTYFLFSLGTGKMDIGKHRKNSKNSPCWLGLRNSALPDQFKSSTMTQETIRKMRNSDQYSSQEKTGLWSSILDLYESLGSVNMK